MKPPAGRAAARASQAAKDLPLRLGWSAPGEHPLPPRGRARGPGRGEGGERGRPAGRRGRPRLGPAAAALARGGASETSARHCGERLNRLLARAANAHFLSGLGLCRCVTPGFGWDSKVMSQNSKPQKLAMDIN